MNAQTPNNEDRSLVRRFNLLGLPTEKRGGQSYPALKAELGDEHAASLVTRVGELLKNQGLDKLGVALPGAVDRIVQSLSPDERQSIAGGGANSDERRKLFVAISDLMRTGDATAFISGKFAGGTPEAEEPQSIDLSGAFPAMIQVLTGRTPEETEVWERFTGGRHKGKQPKAMYFLTYRYSTTGGNILKGFLVVKQHPGASFGRFRFSHFIWGGPENVHVFRETHGLMLACDKTYYFLGFGISISGDKHDPAFRRSREYRELRAEPNIQTFELATIEYDEFDLKEVVLSGLTMASAARHQPVVARLALLYLGTDRELSYELMDHEVVPTELPFESLQDDLLATLRRITELGVTGFDHRLGFKKSGKHFDAAVIAKYARRIEAIIDNTAHWETSGENDDANRDAKNRGALESQGDGRPRA